MGQAAAFPGRSSVGLRRRPGRVRVLARNDLPAAIRVLSINPVENVMVAGAGASRGRRPVQSRVPDLGLRA